MPTLMKIIQTEENQTWNIGLNTITFAQKFEGNYTLYATAPNIEVEVVSKGETSAVINCSGPTAQGYFQATGEQADLLFFESGADEGKSWKEISGTVRLVDPKRPVLIGFSTIDIPGVILGVNKSIIVANKSENSSYLSINAYDTYNSIESSKIGSGLIKPLVFLYNGVETVRIGPLGVGIFNNNPLAPLHIKTSSPSAVIFLERNSGAKLAFNVGTTNVHMGSFSNHEVRFIVNNLPVMYLNSTSLSHGIAVAEGNLHIHAPSNGVTGMFSVLNGSKIGLYNSNFFARISTQTNHPLHLGTNQLAFVYLTTDAKFGINNSNPQAIFHLSGDAIISLSAKIAIPNGTSLQLGANIAETGDKLYVVGTSKLIGTLSIDTGHISILDNTKAIRAFKAKIGVIGDVTAGVALDLSGGVEVMLLPKLTNSQAGAITPVSGMFYFNQQELYPQYHDGSNWRYVNRSLHPSLIEVIKAGTAAGDQPSGFTEWQETSTSAVLKVKALVKRSKGDRRLRVVASARTSNGGQLWKVDIKFNGTLLQTFTGLNTSPTATHEIDGVYMLAEVTSTTWEYIEFFLYAQSPNTAYLSMPTFYFE